MIICLTLRINFFFQQNYKSDNNWFKKGVFICPWKQVFYYLWCITLAPDCFKLLQWNELKTATRVAEDMWNKNLVEVTENNVFMLFDI